MIAATCQAPECGRPARARGLCASHHRQQLRGKALAPLRAGPGRPRGPEQRSITTRIGLDTWSRLEAWAATARYGSAYRVARDVISLTLELWGTPELQERLAALELRHELGDRRRGVAVVKGKARRDKRASGNVA